MRKQISGKFLKSMLIAISILFCVTFTAGAQELTEKMLKTINKLFPDCKIVEMEEETWKGKKVIEIELLAKNGVMYEVYISKDGQILKIEEED
ncbi:MAG: PepSY domain-containing protein [Desulfobacterales bacterium]|nr:PepSY domain-containing protein [Desulfobacterales bacterium]